jgi:hypothetical protein
MLGADGMIQPDKAYPVLLNLPTGLKGPSFAYPTAVVACHMEVPIVFQPFLRLIFSNNTSEKIKPVFNWLDKCNCGCYGVQPIASPYMALMRKAVSSLFRK